MPPDHDVFQRRHLGKQTYVLKRAGNPRFGHFMHRSWLIGFTRQFKTAGIRRIQTGDHIEERGFASAVGADQTIHLAALNRHADITERLQAAESLGNALHIQHRRTHADLLSAGKALPCSGAGHRPRGRHNMMRIMAKAISNWRRMAASKRPPVNSCKGLAT